MKSCCPSFPTFGKLYGIKNDGIQLGKTYIPRHKKRTASFCFAYGPFSFSWRRKTGFEPVNNGFSENYSCPTSLLWINVRFQNRIPICRCPWSRLNVGDGKAVRLPIGIIACDAPYGDKTILRSGNVDDVNHVLKSKCCILLYPSAAFIVAVICGGRVTRIS